MNVQQRNLLVTTRNPAGSSISEVTAAERMAVAGSEDSDSFNTQSGDRSACYPTSDNQSLPCRE
jgi:hypothetical protein